MNERKKRQVECDGLVLWNILANNRTEPTDQLLREGDLD